MTIHFFNDNIQEAEFGVGWGEKNESPAITLKPGDMASFDLDVFNQIPEGENCWVYASTNLLYKQSVKQFKYIKGRGFGGTFKFYMRNFNKLALTYYRLM